jgi:hypothetical protein
MVQTMEAEMSEELRKQLEDAAREVAQWPAWQRAELEAWAKESAKPDYKSPWMVP